MNVEVWFGPAGNVEKFMMDLILLHLHYEHLIIILLYRWYVVCKNETCGTQGPNWSFTTMQEPILNWIFVMNSTDLSNWTIVGPLGTSNWSAASTNSAGGTPPELHI